MEHVEARTAFRKEFAQALGHCSGDAFRLIRQWTSVPEQSARALNEAALDALDNENPRIVRDALEQLTLFGTEADRQPILDHYVKWAEKWRSRAGELDRVLRGGPTADTKLLLDDAYEGNAYTTALLANQGWLPDDALRAKVLANCVGEAMCSARKSPTPTTNLHIGSVCQIWHGLQCRGCARRSTWHNSGRNR